MGVQFNPKTKKYSIRVKHYGRDYEKVIGTDKRLAEIALKQVKLEIQTAKLAGQGWSGFDKMQKAVRPRTFADAANDYMEERGNAKASSISSYKSILNAYLLPAFGSTALKDITSSRLRKFQSSLSTGADSKKEISERRVNNIMQLLRSILKQAENEGAIDRDPSKAVKRLQTSKVKIDPLSDDDLDLALKFIPAQFRPIFVTLAYTGARPNELQALRWSDIDWRRKQISITKGRVRGKEGLPKTKSGERIIPMVAQVETVLTALRASQQEAAVVPISEADYVFTTKKGTPIDKHLDRVWSRALVKAKLRHRPSYQLRHTFVTRCIMQGLPIPYIAKIIGHSTIDTLVRHYSGWIEAETTNYEEKLRESFMNSTAPSHPNRNVS
jgi:integrase